MTYLIVGLVGARTPHGTATCSSAIRHAPHGPPSHAHAPAASTSSSRRSSDRTRTSSTMPHAAPRDCYTPPDNEPEAQLQRLRARTSVSAPPPQTPAVDEQREQCRDSCSATVAAPCGTSHDDLRAPATDDKRKRPEPPAVACVQLRDDRRCRWSQCRGGD